MSTDFRALCAELLAWAEKAAADYIQLADVMVRVRAALAKPADGPAVPEGRGPAAVAEQPRPAPPAEGEVAELVNMLTGIAYWKRHGKPGERDPSPFDIRQADRLARAAELLGRNVAPVPVPMAARPWEREGWCDEQGCCWFGREESDDWSADWTLTTPEVVEEFCTYAPRTVCLPAHALPLPAQGGEVE